MQIRAVLLVANGTLWYSEVAYVSLRRLRPGRTQDRRACVVVLVRVVVPAKMLHLDAPVDSCLRCATGSGT
jgi:hypothetical protein